MTPVAAPPAVVTEGPAEPSQAAQRPVVRLDLFGSTYFWLVAVLALALVSAARAIVPVLGPNVVQDDARQWIFWMARFRDPELFRNDLIADLYESLAPPGYKAVYWALSPLADPLLASKLLPPVLGTAAVVFTFLLTRRLHPSPLPAFLAAALLNWFIWQGSAISSATPRAFQVPLLAAILWSLAAERLALTTGLLVVAALFYPVTALVGIALLGVRLVGVRGWRPVVSRRRADWLVFIVATVLVALVLLEGDRSGERFGPLVSAAQMAAMRDFGEDGRHPFFISGKFLYLDPTAQLTPGQRVAGVLYAIAHSGAVLQYPLVSAALLLLLLCRQRLPEVRRLSGRAVLLPQLLAASFGLFFLAQLLLFRLYYPDRYVVWSQILIFVVMVGLVLGMLIETASIRLAPALRAPVAAALGITLALCLFTFSAGSRREFVRDTRPALTAYLRTLPKDIMVAGVPLETNSLPVFAQRSVLMSYESIQAYHLGYHEQLRPRIEDLIDAYYDETPEGVAQFAAQYGVDVFLVDRLAYDDDTASYAWRGGRGQWEPYTTMVQGKIRRAKRRPPVLLDLARTCAVLDDGQVAVVPVSCLPPPRSDPGASS